MAYFAHYKIDIFVAWCRATVPDNRDHGANMGPTWVLSAPGRPHVGPMNLAIRGSSIANTLEKLQSSSKLLMYSQFSKCIMNVFLNQLCAVRSSPAIMMSWKHFPHYWPFVGGIHQSLVVPLTKYQ